MTNNYDTIKIKCNNKYLIKNISTFNIQYNPTTGKEKGRSYNSAYHNSIPFNIYVNEDYCHNKLSIEFSSKLLLDNYPLLINKNTIEECLYNLKKLGICEVDINGVLDTAAVTRLDATKDIRYELNSDVLDAMNENVGNYKRFKWEHYEKEGIEFVSDVKCSYGKEVFKLYDKSKEIMAAAQNRQFLAMLESPNKVVEHFEGLTRFEATFNTQNKIKSALGIEDTYLMTVLISTANPLLYQFDRVFNVSKKHTPREIKSAEQWEMMKVIESCDFDLKSIEQELRKGYASRSGCADRMKKYRQVHDILQQDNRNIIEEVRNVLISN